MDIRMVGLVSEIYRAQVPDEAPLARAAHRVTRLGGQQVARAALVLLAGAAMALAPLASWLVWFRGR